jgi:cyclopropane fatty-acyl-phospholipid synthase-like methyltransferase
MPSIETAYRNLGFRDYTVRLQYGLLSRQGSLAEESTFMNMGYWKGEPKTLDEASRALVTLVAEEAKLGPGQRVLDVGCGFGDQDILWIREFGPARIDAVNITKSQLEAAAEKVASEELNDRISLWAASATSLPFEDATFDVVLCVEAAHHFNTRERFFAEAFRLLKPGGRFVAADILPNPGTAIDGLVRMQMNPANVYPRGEYADKLERAGYTASDVRSIREHVYVPFAAHLNRRMADPTVQRRMNPLLRWFARRHVKSVGTFESLDFVIAKAVRS